MSDKSLSSRLRTFSPRRLLTGSSSARKRRSRRKLLSRLQPLEQRQLLAADFVVDVQTPVLREDGGSTVATLSFINIPTQASTYSISSSDPSRLQTPAEITVQGGQGSVSFPISAIDNTIVDGGMLLDLNVSSIDGQVSTRAVAIADDEANPGFSVEVNPSVVSEANSPSVSVTLTFDEPLETSKIFLPISSNRDRADLRSEINVSAGTTSATIDVDVFDNPWVDGDAVVDIFVLDQNVENAAVTSLTVLDDDQPLQYDFAFDPPTVSENNGTSTGTITLPEPLDIWVDFTIEIDDYRLNSPDFFLSIAPGDTTTSFTVTHQDDPFINGDRTVDVTIRDSTGVSTAYPITILDDDVATVGVDIWSEVTFEGVTGEGFQVGLSHPFPDPVEVTLTSSDPSAIAVPSSVMIPAGQTSATFGFDVLDDNLVDGDQTVTITAQLPDGASGSDSVVVLDGNTTSLSLSLATLDATVTEGGSPLGAELVLTTPMASDLEVSIVAIPANQVTFPSTVTIPAGQTRAAFEFVAVDDLIAEESFQQITLAISTAGNVQNPDFESQVYVLDNDAPAEVELFLPDFQLTEGDSLTASLLLNAPQATDTDVFFNLFGDGSAADLDFPSPVTIPAGQTRFDFVVTAIDDTLLESDIETVIIDVSSSVTVINNFPILDIRDNDSPNVTLSLPSTSFDENAGVVEMTISVGGTLENDLSIELQSTDTSELTVPSTLTLPAGSESVNVPVTIVDDGTLDSDQLVSILVAISDPRLNASEFIDVTVVNTTVQNRSVDLADSSIDENGGSTTATVMMSVPSDQDETFFLTIVGSPLVDIGAGTIVIPAGATSGTQTISAIDNDQFTGDQFTVVEVLGVANDPVPLAITVIDDESEPNLPPALVSVNGLSDLSPTPLGQATTLDGIVRDLNPDDALSVTVDWGDENTSVATLSTLDPFDAAFDASHVYATSGIYTVVVTVSDGTESTSQELAAFVSGLSTPSDGSLVLIGTGGDDRFDLLSRNSGADVEVRWDFDGNRAGQTTTLPVSSLTRVDVRLGNGNNRVRTSSGLTLPMQVTAGFGTDRIDTGKGNDSIVKLGGVSNIRTRGGSDTIVTGDGPDVINSGGGNDFVDAGGGDDVITGGGGNDLLLGRSGSDIIRGGSGKDVMIGGSGADMLYGDGSSDLLIAGMTSYDDDRLALDAIAATWSLGGSYSSRVAALTAGVGVDGSTRLVEGQTVFGETGVSDFLQGGKSSDWFFADLDDQLDDVAGSEFLNG